MFSNYRKLGKFIKEIIIFTANIPKKNKKQIYHQTKWPLILNTCVKSQIMTNKPKHLVKKVIR